MLVHLFFFDVFSWLQICQYFLLGKIKRIILLHIFSSTPILQLQKDVAIEILCNKKYQCIFPRESYVQRISVVFTHQEKLESSTCDHFEKWLRRWFFGVKPAQLGSMLPPLSKFEQLRALMVFLSKRKELCYKLRKPQHWEIKNYLVNPWQTEYKNAVIREKKNISFQIIYMVPDLSNESFQAHILIILTILH